MTDERIAELRAVTEKATPGKRASAWDDETLQDEHGEGALIAIAGQERPVRECNIIVTTWYDGPRVGCTRENAAHMAAFDRETCLDLLDELKRLRESNAELAATRDRLLIRNLQLACVIIDAVEAFEIEVPRGNPTIAAMRAALSKAAPPEEPK